MSFSFSVLVFFTFNSVDFTQKRSFSPRTGTVRLAPIPNSLEVISERSDRERKKGRERFIFPKNRTYPVRLSGHPYRRHNRKKKNAEKTIAPPGVNANSLLVLR